MKCKSAPVYVPFMTTVIGADSVELNFLEDSVTSYTQLQGSWRRLSGWLLAWCWCASQRRWDGKPLQDSRWDWSRWWRSWNPWWPLRLEDQRPAVCCETSGSCWAAAVALSTEGTTRWSWWKPPWLIIQSELILKHLLKLYNPENQNQNQTVVLKTKLTNKAEVQGCWLISYLK